ncbi:hypothetical protein NEUTE1DRAFT_104632 [Neurospora tetrasperma FGSC 2508]|uniref:Uncharacterized protein n=1 Tax=Neurospora tetrasperma (strain FGSC 2508 / ATCC MYA-4615 / P0657) TaxID=510951 RepID=F8MYB5_NEUT8|nr:uncharacterized protein NEUTE1DRAFT_104632 [Neurospora tetrasperma FGSC 2508]EGO51597.1 hypothetical protein NEUTE1DRAFT_104632 [Neurospora tetrasperma FGSC 2508]
MLTRSIRRSSQCWMQHGEMEIGQEVVDACLVNDWSLQSQHVIGLLTGSLETKVGFMIEHPVSGSGLTDLETQEEGLVGLAEIL